MAAAVMAVLCCGCSDNGIWEAFYEQRYGTNNCGTDGTAGSCKTVTIGGQTWMAENLNYTPASGNSWCYDGMEYNCKRFGRLYDWNTAKRVCPSGWRLPSDGAWDSLMTAVGGSSTAGKKLKARSGWYNNGNGTDDYGFSALPGSYRRSGGGFDDAGHSGYWWTATEDGGNDAYYRIMSFYDDDVYKRSDSEDYGFSVRCVKNE